MIIPLSYPYHTPIMPLSYPYHASIMPVSCPYHARHPHRRLCEASGAESAMCRPNRLPECFGTGSTTSCTCAALQADRGAGRRSTLHMLACSAYSIKCLLLSGNMLVLHIRFELLSLLCCDVGLVLLSHSRTSFFSFEGFLCKMALFQPV